jgi:hypothetical protein
MLMLVPFKGVCNVYAGRVPQTMISDVRNVETCMAGNDGKRPLARSATDDVRVRANAQSPPFAANGA